MQFFAAVTGRGFGAFLFTLVLFLCQFTNPLLLFLALLFLGLELGRSGLCLFLCLAL